MRLQDRIYSVCSVDKRSGKMIYSGEMVFVLSDCKAAADVVEAINVALKMGCSGNEILEKDSAIRLAIESIMGDEK